MQSYIASQLRSLRFEVRFQRSANRFFASIENRRGFALHSSAIRRGSPLAARRDSGASSVDRALEQLRLLCSTVTRKREHKEHKSATEPDSRPQGSNISWRAART